MPCATTRSYCRPGDFILRAFSVEPCHEFGRCCPGRSVRPAGGMGCRLLAQDPVAQGSARRALVTVNHVSWLFDGMISCAEEFLWKRNMFRRYLSVVVIFPIFVKPWGRLRTNMYVLTTVYAFGSCEEIRHGCQASGANELHAVFADGEDNIHNTYPGSHGSRMGRCGAVCLLCLI